MIALILAAYIAATPASSVGLFDTPIYSWDSPAAGQAYEGCERTAGYAYFAECLSLKGFTVRRSTVVEKRGAPMFDELSGREKAGLGCVTISLFPTKDGRRDPTWQQCMAQRGFAPREPLPKLPLGRHWS